MRIAAIDIGSNSIRQIVADVSSTGAIRVVDEMKAAPRLGAGIHNTGRLSDEAGDAAIAILSRMSELAGQLGAKRRRVVATSAVREAENGAEWLARVKQQTGISQRRHKQLRSMLIEAAWLAITKDPALLDAYQQLTKRMKGSEAIVRIARKLLRRMRAVLISGEPYKTGVVE